eukprot:g6007.t1
MGETSLLAHGSHTIRGQKPVALAAGYIDNPHKDYVTKPRKGVIAVMTSNWHLMCFDHNLKLMWSRDVHSDMHINATIHEVAILITNHTVYEHDRGMVIVGGSMDIGSSFDDESVLNKEEMEEDVFEAEQAFEKRESERYKRLGEDENMDEFLDEMQQVDGADYSRHFSVYAFEGASGTSRWRHVGSEFNKDLHEIKDNTTPQKYYKLRAEDLESREYSEVSCRDYRESVLHNLPHKWNQRIDTKMSLSYFEKHKVGKGQKKKDLASHTTPSRRRVPCPGGKCPKNAVSNAIEKLTDKAMSGGRVSTTQSQPKNFNPVTSFPPNAIVAHLKEGIHAIHLYSGRSLCKLHLPEGGLHVDLNGDGVLDHIHTSTVPTSNWVNPSVHHRVPLCYAYATSGVPPREPFFNGSICGHHWMRGFGENQALNIQRDAHNRIDVASPEMLPIPTPRGHYRFRYGQRGYAIFLNNEGELTAFDSKGKKQWMISTNCHWSSYRKSSKKMQPTLRAFPLRPDALPTAILVAGVHYAAVVSEHGNILATFTLPDRPVVPLEIVDFNGDGLNDVIMIGGRDVYGYVQMQDLSGQPFGMLVLCLIVAMGTIYAAQHSGTASTHKMKRSTD